VLREDRVLQKNERSKHGLVFEIDSRSFLAASSMTLRLRPLRPVQVNSCTGGATPARRYNL